MTSRPARRRRDASEPDERAIVMAHEQACDELPQGAEYEEWKRHHAIALLQRTRPQLAFLHLEHQTGLFWGGVRTGKSTILGHDAALYLAGRHPRQLHRPPTVQLMAGRSWSQMVDQLRVVWSLLDPRWFRASLDLSEGTLRGQRFPILTAISGPGVGSQLRLGTFEMGPLSVQGWTLHRANLDEPPKQPYYTEVRSRVISTRGCVRMGFCPTLAHIGQKGQDLDWVWSLVDSGEIGLVRAPLTLESVTPAEGLIRLPYMSRRDIEAFSREIPSRDRAMRLGLARYPESVGAYFDAWSRALVQDRGVPSGYLAIGIDHGSKPGRQRASLMVVSGHYDQARVHVLRHYQGDGRTESEQDAAGILAMLRSTGHTLEDVDLWIGDRAHGGDRKGGIKSNQRLLAAFARLLGIETEGVKMAEWRKKLPRPLQRIWTPAKDGYSVWDDVEVMHRLMVRGSFTVDPSCGPIIEDIEQWAGSYVDPHKDGIDSVRYGFIPMLSPYWHRAT